MKKGKVRIEFVSVDVPYRKIKRDLFLSVNGKEVRVYVNILQDQIADDHEFDYDISESETEKLTEQERKAVVDWCDDEDLERIKA